MERPPDSVWLFLRGLARESAHWGNFLPLFKATVPNAHIVTLDLPGAGARYLEESPKSITEITRMVRAQWKSFNASIPGDAPRHLLGLSLGGMVGIEWVSSNPEDFARAVFINTSLPSLSPPYERLQPGALKSILSTLLARDPVTYEKIILSMTSNRPDRYDELAIAWAEIQKARPMSFKNKFNQLRAAATWKPPKTGPKIPVLLLSSKSDRLCNPRCSEKLQKAWECDFEQNETGGHELSLDEPQWVADRVAQWMKKS